MSGDEPAVVLPDVQAAANRLAKWEADLDPAQPESSGLRVLAYGEISATLVIPDPLFAGLVAKRMSGFSSALAVADYVKLVQGYCEDLARVGLSVVDTLAVPVERSDRPPVAYLVQPQLSSELLGNVLLHEVDDATLRVMIRSVLSQVDAVLASNSESSGLAIDAQMSNWWFGAGADGRPTLVDVGTPFVRRRGKYLMEPRILLAAVPPGVRAWYLWRQAGEKYMDDYFDRRLVGLDLLGNFIKEGARERIPVGVEAVNEWLATGTTLASTTGSGVGEPGGLDAVTEDQVRKYYDDDAATLELFLRVRRADRWFRTKVLRSAYDFVLPGPVQRG